MRLHLKLAPITICCLVPLAALGQPTPAGNTNPGTQTKSKTNPPPATANYLPLCSTEKVNGNCFVNVNRRYPIALPTIRMRRDARITVYLFYPFAFEHVTLDPGPAAAYQGTDQAAALVNALIPLGKGTNPLGVAIQDQPSNLLATQAAGILPLFPNPNPNQDLANKIRDEIKDLNRILTETLSQDSLTKIESYLTETNAIYVRIAEITSALPRPLDDNGRPLRTFPDNAKDPTPYPWDDYPGWARDMRRRILEQGIDTTSIWSYLVTPCQNQAAGQTPADPPPLPGPWLAPARTCQPPNNKTQPSSAAPAIDPAYDMEYATLTRDFAMLPQGQPDPATYSNLQDAKAKLDQRQQRLNALLQSVQIILPAGIAKYSTDMQNYLTAISVIPPDIPDPTFLGNIPGPGFVPTSANSRVLSLYKALAPTITFTVNVQNEVVNSLLQAPAASLKQPIVTISVLYADPRFEESTGALLSWLPNRTFSNLTEVAVTGQTPSSSDVKIIATKTIPPLVLPYVAANYRIGSEFTWGRDGRGRRGAVYATAALALNPYNTQLEYAAGLSLSWRYLMFSPLFHLGHAAHLTQGEQVGQTWCSYASTATGMSTPPLCTGAPPAPSTKYYWRGAFSIGIGVRIPTLFSSTNQ